MKMGLSEAEQLTHCIGQSNSDYLCWKSLVFGKRKELLTQKVVILFVKSFGIFVIGP